eukprot:7780682-Alexandrium_andersonii.AAC.1
MTKVAGCSYRGGAQARRALVAGDGRPAPARLPQGGAFARRALAAGDRRATRLRGARPARRALVTG